MAGQGGIWRGDQPLAGAWDLVHDEATKTVTLRWPDNQVPYEVIGSTNLLFGELVDRVLPVSGATGTVDATTFPGHIQFEFVDPDANGSRRFWRVREQ